MDFLIGFPLWVYALSCIVRGGGFESHLVWIVDLAVGHVFFAYELDCPLDPLDLAIDGGDLHLLPRLLHSSFLHCQEDPTQVFLGRSKVLRILSLQRGIWMFIVQKKLITFTVQNLDDWAAKHGSDDRPVVEHCLYGLI